MSNALEQLNKVQDQVLDTIASFQKPVVETVAKVAGRVEGVVPEVPSIDVAGQVAERFPTAEELISSNFDFVGKLLDQQRAFIEQLILAAKPVSEKVSPLVADESAKAKVTKAAKAA